MITPQDLVVVGFLVFLEGILSIDNAVVLAVMVKHLPKEQQRRALTYGLAGAVVFRLAALAIATHLMQWRWVKFVGGGYLLYVGLTHLTSKESHPEAHLAKRSGFWKTVVMIELMDIAFAVDSILAAVAVSPKFWVVFTGGFMGVVLIRFAATMFARILDKFPTFEVSAYLLIVVIGLKLVVDGFHLPGVDFHAASSPAFWVFWGLMALSVAYGFRRKSH